MSNPKLVFSMDLRSSSSLVTGNLKLVTLDGQEVDYLATSGCRGWQDKNNVWSVAKGPIPPGFDYRVATTPLYEPNVTGINGNFFHITPDPVTSSHGVKRGEFGIHFDAHVPGTAGCIALEHQDAFNTFSDRMKKIASAGIHSIPLQIVYS